MIDDIEAYLARGEARFPDLRAHAVKQVIWHDSARRQRTPFVLINVHGFSASSGEVRPLPDLVAKALGANLFFMRLTGHGRSGEAMAEATIDDWLADFDEALDVAARLGERIVILATSTGATLATVALSRPGKSEKVAALVYLSPNFRVRSAGAFLLTVPGIRNLLPHIMGKYRRFTPRNEAHGLLWTAVYPFKALLPMAELVKRAGRVKVEDFAIPALFIRSPLDKVVDPAATNRIVARWRAPHAVIDPGPVGDEDYHIIAGDALSPHTTGPLVERISTWLRQVLAVK
ncbi:alpha/beta fold hydrolase [Rhizobium sp. RU36D]|uniref:alpha/beta hydrolase n=1 Tax=Rhizobium sp. RU36D TaxID=1907415 RepID=UPI0009D7DC46|nr:alpha/beta fold hydrolase [Rhizobium sp. RU36D]SMC63974.1 Esterase/lipase [Rhizobium sp. RU36D]